MQLHFPIEANKYKNFSKTLFTMKEYLHISTNGLIIKYSPISKIKALCTTNFQRNPAAYYKYEANKAVS